MDLELEAV
uniref:Uncharacterized protein n=1 Tax=Arundo donax TaxID=35708 RepID=A0A0A9C955_ARUDO